MSQVTPTLDVVEISSIWSQVTPQAESIKMVQYREFIITMLCYCVIDIIGLHDDRVTTIFLQIIYKLSDSRKLTMPYITQHGWGPVGKKTNHASALAFKCPKYSWIFIMNVLYYTKKKVI